MPIYMDLHKFPENETAPTKEKLFEAHSRDLRLQSKYDIKYLVYIANVEKRTIFCIIDAPDIESCIALHNEAHGESACHIIEVQGGDFIDFIGDPLSVNEFDMVELVKGIPDSGYRTIMAIDYISFLDKDDFPQSLKNLIEKTAGAKFAQNGGKEVVVFREADIAIDFAANLVSMFKKYKKIRQQELRIGIAAGEPVSEGSDSIYGETIELANGLCGIASNEGTLISSLANKLVKSRFPVLKKDNSSLFKVLHLNEELFFKKLVRTIDKNEMMPYFSTQWLAGELGISHSGLYRKIKKITGLSAVSFLQERRLRKALLKISEQKCNISEIAYESGFSSPSYFTRSFKKRFGCTPAELVNTQYSSISS